MTPFFKNTSHFTLALRYFLVSAVFCLSLTLFPVLAVANDGPVSPQEDISVLENRLRENFLQQNEASDSPMEVESERRTQPSATDEVKVFVKQIIIKNQGEVTDEELAPVLANYVNREQSLGDLENLAQNIERLYLKKRIVAFVFLPPQTIENGVVQIEVVRATINEVDFEDNARSSDAKLTRYLTIKPGDVLDQAQLSKSYRRLSRNPDRAVGVVLAAGEKPGTTDVKFKITEKNPMHYRFMMDNRGTPSSGTERYGFSVNHSDVTGNDDILTAGGVFGLNFGALIGQYTFPVPEWNSDLSIGASVTQVTPKGLSGPFGVNGTSQTYFFRANRYLIDEDRMNLKLIVGYDHKESRTKLNSGTFRRERLRVFNFEPVLMLQDDTGVTEIKNHFDAAVKSMGAAIYADPLSNKLGLDPDFFKWEGSIRRLQKLPHAWRLDLKLSGQMPTERLPSSEGMALGGASSVKGYPEFDFIADAGVLMNVDLSKRLIENGTFVNSLDAVFFIDEGYGEIRGTTSEQRHSRHLASIGPGFRANFADNWLGSLYFGFPIGDDPIDDPTRFRIHYSIQAEY